MKILILGNKGFVGRNFQKYLLAQGHDVWGMDIKDGQDMDCRKFFRENTDVFDLVLHCAAVGPNKVMQDSNPFAIAENFAIDSEMFAWAVRTKQIKVVYFSSTAAYPAALQEDKTVELYESDINLDDIKNPENIYGWVKLMGELQAREARKRGLNVYVFRPGSGYNWDQDDVFPFKAIMQRVINKENPIEIWGSGNQTRDFINIKDIIGAVMKAIELDIQEPINLSSGTVLSFNQLAEKMFEIAEWRPSNGIKNLIDKPEGVFARVPNIDKMLSFYTPTISIEQGIHEALDNILKNAI